MRGNLARRVVRVLATFGLITFLSGTGHAGQPPTNPVPYISSISPLTAAPGSGDFPLTVRGVNFVASSTVFWTQHLTSVGLQTVFVSSTELTATVSSSDVENFTSALISVQSPGTSGKPLKSNQLTFLVTKPTPSLVFRLTNQSPSAGNHPNIPIFADLNSDGIVDLAVSNQSQGKGNVSVFYGLGTGAFSAATNYLVQNGPEGMAVGDFNNDGYPDLAVAERNNSSYSILLGKADGTFATAVTTSFPVLGTFPYAVVTGDFDQNGTLDLAVACQDPSTGGFVYILLGNGDGTFGAPQHYGSLGLPEGLVAADFDGDGKLDLATSDFQNSDIWVLTGNGDGTFSAGTAYTAAPASGVAGIVANDLNNDGQTDLAVSDLTTGGLTVFLNSSGTFNQTSESPISVPGGYFIGSADMDGDGIPDLAVADFGSHNFSELAGNGDGTFQAPVSFEVDSRATSIVGLALADVAGNGRFDVVTTALPETVVEVLLQAAVLNPDPSSLTFPNTNVGATSAAMTTTLQNTGSAPLVIRAISSTDPEFAVSTSDPCSTLPATLWVGDFCTVSVTFAPSTYGTRSGSISITDNASATAQTVPLSGVGLEAVASLTGSLNFPNQFQGTSSSPLTATLTNSGNAALTITSIAVTSSYSQTNTCGSSLAANSSCSISVTFKPTAQGSAPGTLTVTDNSGDASSTTQSLSMTGTGIGPTAGIAPTSLTFGSQLVSTSSATQAVTLSNNGTADLTVASITIGGTNGGDFSQTNNCGTKVVAGKSCTVTVTFKPTISGTRTATVTITDNTGGVTGSVQTANLTGTAVAPVASLPASVPAFAATLVNSSTSQSVTLSNTTGSAALTITSIVIGGSNAGDFSQTNNCGTSVAAGASCSITVTFKPKATGTRSGTLTVTDNTGGVSGSTQVATLTGTGTAPVVSVVPTSLTFAPQIDSTSSPPQTITVSNATGTAALSITGITISDANSDQPGGFTQTNNCGTSLAAGSSCTITVTFDPVYSGGYNDILTITDNNNGVSGSTQTVTLTGTGIIPEVTLSPSSLVFPAQNVGTASVLKPVTITNAGTATLSLTSITASGDYSVTNPCGSSLAVGASCTVNVTFKPTAIGTRTGALMVTDNAPESPQTVSLTGTGLGATVSLSTNSLTFGAELVGVSSAPQSVTLTNTGNAALSLTSISATGDWGQTNTCASSVAAGASCSISVVFTATKGGLRTNVLTITNNAVGSAQGGVARIVVPTGNATGGSTQTVSLSGTGQDFSLTATSTSASVSAGQTATYNLTLTPSGGLNQAVALSCSGLSSSSQANCTVSPASVTPTGATAVTVTVTTTAPSNLLPFSRPIPQIPGRQGEWILIALLGLAGIAWLARRRPHALPVRLRLALVTACVAVVLALALGGCGSSGNGVVTPTPHGGTPSGNYSITVTGTATSGSVTDSHNLALTMTVH